MGGKRYSVSTINKLLSLRKKGKTITELMEVFGMPKTTVWHHVHGLILDPVVSKSLRSRKGGTHKRKLHAWKESEIFSRQLLAHSQQDFIIAVAMLYWAEGHKKDFIFTNTDVKMLQAYIYFLLEILKIPKNRIKVMVRTSAPIDSVKALSYWSKHLKLPLLNFISNHTDLNKTKTTYGICRVMVSKSSFYHKVMVSLIAHVQEKLFKPL